MIADSLGTLEKIILSTSEELRESGLNQEAIDKVHKFVKTDSTYAK